MFEKNSYCSHIIKFEKMNMNNISRHQTKPYQYRGRSSSVQRNSLKFDFSARNSFGNLLHVYWHFISKVCRADSLHPAFPWILIIVNSHVNYAARDCHVTYESPRGKTNVVVPTRSNINQPVQSQN